VKIVTTIMIQITGNPYIQYLTLDKEQHSTMRNVPRILFVYTSYVSFCNLILILIKICDNFCNYNLYFIMVITGYTVSGTKEY
jgi:hypothetical protein